MAEEKNMKIEKIENKSTIKKEIDRTSFLKKVGAGVFASLLLPGVLSDKFSFYAKDAIDKLNLPQLPPKQEGEDVLVRMMRDLQRALKKPVKERKWAMVIDLRKCVGCHSCTISCVAENKLGPGTVYRPVLEEEFGEYPNVRERFIPRPCMQCEEPSCTGVCPVGATWKREDGIVEIDYEQCIGCRYCITACPYSARTFDTGKYYNDNSPVESPYIGKDNAELYERKAAYEYGKEWHREEGESPVGNARKCHFCLHRIEKGLLPGCTVSCIGRATYFGDANDKESLVAELIGQSNVMHLKEEMGTKPKVHYLL